MKKNTRKIEELTKAVKRIMNIRQDFQYKKRKSIFKV